MAESLSASVYSHIMPWADGFTDRLGRPIPDSAEASRPHDIEKSPKLTVKESLDIIENRRFRHKYNLIALGESLIVRIYDPVRVHNVVERELLRPYATIRRFVESGRNPRFHPWLKPHIKAAQKQGLEQFDAKLVERGVNIDYLRGLAQAASLDGHTRRRLLYLAGTLTLGLLYAINSGGADASVQVKTTDRASAAVVRKISSPHVPDMPPVTVPITPSTTQAPAPTPVVAPTPAPPAEPTPAPPPPPPPIAYANTGFGKYVSFKFTGPGTPERITEFLQHLTAETDGDEYSQDTIKLYSGVDLVKIKDGESKVINVRDCEPGQKVIQKKIKGKGGGIAAIGTMKELVEANGGPINEKAGLCVKVPGAPAA